VRDCDVDATLPRYQVPGERVDRFCGAYVDFDVTRSGAPAAHLAGIELAGALIVIARGMPDIRLTGRRPRGSRSPGITGPVSLPVEFTTGA